VKFAAPQLTGYLVMQTPETQMRFGTGALATILVLALLFVSAGAAESPHGATTQPVTRMMSDPPELPSEAFGLALVVSGQLLPPDNLVSTVERDLAAIREYDTFFETIRDRPPWIPGQVIVALEDSAGAAFEAGTYTGFDELFAQLGVPEIEYLSQLKYVLLTFAAPYHGYRLADLFGSADGVKHAGANHYISEVNDIHVDPGEYNGRYTFLKVWDCDPRGCRYRHQWVFQVSEGVVTLIEESGTPIAVEGATWSHIKERYR